MLESGHAVFNCQIVKPLSENNIYHSYLVNCSDSTVAKLFLVLPDPLFEPKSRQFFLDQVNWLSGQTFPAIGTPIKAGEIEGKLACLYPLPPGEPLSQGLNDGFSIQQSLELTKKIAECLTIPHSADLLHGNLSPETIYLDNHSPYLADFSLSQLVKLDYLSGIDPHYTSPEQVRGEIPGSATDIYSLGCIFYHLLTGQPPFSGDDALAIAMQHLSGEVPGLSKELSICQPLLTSMTTIAVDERLTVDALLEQLDQLLAKETIDQPPHSVAADDKLHDDSNLEDDFSLFDPVTDNAEIAARIEARLKEHSVVFQESFAGDSLESSTFDATEGLDQASPEKKSRTSRYILLLLLGVLIGSGSYFLFFNREIPVVAAPEQQSSHVLETDLDRGIRMLETSDHTGAETEFKSIIEAFPNDPRAYNNLAALYASEGNYDLSRDYLEQALEIDETYATVYRNLGSVYAEMARGSYGRALQLDETKSLLSLQVFTSQGVTNLEPITEDVPPAAIQDQTAEVVTPQPESAKIAQPIIIAETISSSQPVNDKVIKEVVSQSESKPKAVASPVAAVQLEPADNSINDSPTMAAVAGSIDKLIVASENKSSRIDKVAKMSIEKVPVEVPDIDETGAVLEQENVENFLKRWAHAWSNQDVDDYLTFYAEKFIPPAGKKRAAWENERRIRLLKPKEIIVNLSRFQVAPQKNNRVQVEVIQDYRSDFLTDRTKKIFDLLHTENGWKILRERSLGIAR
ncbi:MAG: tetratricopeptide repeat protein [Desulfuromusa sp.]|nr:tetratricopeptide repeat protein [Desulfuromusa sp.]